MEGHTDDAPPGLNDFGVTLPNQYAKDNVLQSGASRVSTSRRCNSCKRAIKDIHWRGCKQCGTFDLHNKVAAIQDECHITDAADDAMCPHNNAEHVLDEITYGDYNTTLRNVVWKDMYAKIKRADFLIQDDYHLYLATQGLQRDTTVTPAEVNMVALKVLDYITKPESQKLLCLDGGGVRGYFTIMTLLCVIKNLYPTKTGTVNEKGFISPDHPQWKLVRHFDLIGGTSTGGLIAFCLTVGYDLELLKQVYTNFNHYFARPFISWLTRVPIFCAKYDSTNIDNKIREIVNSAWEYYGFGGHDTTMGTLMKIKEKHKDLSMPALLINAYNVTNNQIMIFQSDSNHHESYDIIDVLRATKAAPTYFPPVEVMCPPIEEGQPSKLCSFVDGGMFANDPALTTVFAKSMHTGNQTYEVVSIGTTAFPSTVRLSAHSGGYLSWLFPNPVEQFKNLFRGKEAVTDSSGLIIETFMQANASLTESFMSDLDPRKVRRFKFNFFLSSPMQLDDPGFTELVDKNFERTPNYLYVPDSIDMAALVAFIRRHITYEADDEIFRRVLKKDEAFSKKLETQIQHQMRKFKKAGRGNQ